MIFILTIILVIIFFSNFSLYWILFHKVKKKKSKVIKLFYRSFPIICVFVLITIPIINSSFLRVIFPENSSYFGDYWNLFALLGIAFMIIGINFVKKAKKAYKNKHITRSDLITSGIFRIIRHPIYSGWIIFYLGAALISDSLISLILCPFFYVFLEFHALVKEKLVFVPRYGDKYEKFKEKTPNRIIPTPLNLLLIIIVFIIVYVGFINNN